MVMMSLFLEQMGLFVEIQLVHRLLSKGPHNKFQGLKYYFVLCYFVILKLG